MTNFDPSDDPHQTLEYIDDRLDSWTKIIQLGTKRHIPKINYMQNSAWNETKRSDQIYPSAI